MRLGAGATVHRCRPAQRRGDNDGGGVAGATRCHRPADPGRSNRCGNPDGFEPRRGCSGCRRGTSIEEVRARTRRFGCFHHS
jgi:hypothetical protein